MSPILGSLMKNNILNIKDRKLMVVNLKEKKMKQSSAQLTHLAPCWPLIQTMIQKKNYGMQF